MVVHFAAIGLKPRAQLRVHHLFDTPVFAVAVVIPTLPSPSSTHGSPIAGRHQRPHQLGHPLRLCLCSLHSPTATKNQQALQHTRTTAIAAPSPLHPRLSLRPPPASLPSSIHLSPTLRAANHAAISQPRRPRCEPPNSSKRQTQAILQPLLPTSSRQPASIQKEQQRRPVPAELSAPTGCARCHCNTRQPLHAPVKLTQQHQRPQSPSHHHRRLWHPSLLRSPSAHDWCILSSNRTCLSIMACIWARKLETSDLNSTFSIAIIYICRAISGLSYSTSRHSWVE
ncbi:uncharacterized protein LOC131158689 [Malania oleifera]|uniref:uncharacterized protein LOC131158689 n=1 Tax=Malania oleifera TaxID=397392 RepID=UPI0025AEC97C|nr:uncharacterized protein LOC131158689 [Malania oleifera]